MFVSLEEYNYVINMKCVHKSCLMTSLQIKQQYLKLLYRKMMVAELELRN